MKVKITKENEYIIRSSTLSLVPYSNLAQALLNGVIIFWLGQANKMIKQEIRLRCLIQDSRIFFTPRTLEIDAEV